MVQSSLAVAAALLVGDQAGGFPAAGKHGLGGGGAARRQFGGEPYAS